MGKVLIEDDGIDTEFLWCAVEKDLSLEKQVSTVGDTKRLLYIMVCNKYTDIALLELPYNILDVLDGNGIDTCKRLVQHDELRVDGQAAGYLGTTPLSATKLVAQVLTHLLEMELADKVL